MDMRVCQNEGIPSLLKEPAFANKLNYTFGELLEMLTNF